MTKAEAIRQLQRQVSPVGERASIEAISMAIAVLEKENEPAQPEGCTSSGTQNKFLQDNDNTESIVCQALKYGKLAAETGATITYSGGVFIIAPRVGEQP